jgi:hypothetical protein
MVKKQENRKTVHEDNIITTLHTQGTSNNKYEETEKCGSSIKSIVRVPQTAFGEKHGLHTQSMN